MSFRSLTAAAFLAGAALAAPPLTTVQDVLYRADGTRLDGTVTISWTSFEAIDGSAISTQSVTVRVVDGNLRVQLVPTTTSTPATYYSVKYNSDGRVQFEETWSVPSSAQPVRLRDVRVAVSNTPPPPGEIGEEQTVTETDVIGLIADLGARPMKGPGYAAGRVAVVSALGALESAVGAPTDCVRVDGSSGPCGSTTPFFVDADTLSGIVDGANRSFTLSAAPSPAASLTIYRNGIRQKAGEDYAVEAKAVQFAAVSVPQPGDTLLASYRIAGTSEGDTGQLYPSAQVLCSGMGAATNSLEMASVGTCSIPAGVLGAGDRVEIKFDLEHAGTAGGFTFETLWDATSLARRDAAAADTLVSGRADITMNASGAQFSQQSWGTALPFAAAVGTAADSYSDGVAIEFRAKAAQAGDVVTLRGFGVVRVP